MRDFMGLNVHTVQFKPALYAPVCRRVRDYHPLNWDIDKDTSQATQFPFAANRVDWGTMYGSWNKAGFDIDVCAMFDQIAPQAWKDFGADSRKYGESFAKFFGPSGHALVTSIEIGNEPSKYSESQYRTIFESMARGVRAGDPKLQIATCAVMTGKPDQWSKPMSAIEGLNDLYDALNVHSYPFKEKWPTWRRSYPEDPTIPFLKSIQDVIDWRNAHAPGKQVWLTEFGYDAATKPPGTGPWEKWEGATDEQQALYIIRAFLMLSAMDLHRAYLYFFNDKDEPQLHGASGITRNFKPKPSFYAMGYLYKTLGDYRYLRTRMQRNGLCCYEYEKPGTSERILVAWAPNSKSGKNLTMLGARILRAEQLPLTHGVAKGVKFNEAGEVEEDVTETPMFLWMK